MSLTRHWYPSGNRSGGGTKRLLVIHTMEGFTGPNGAQDCAIYFQSDCGASSQVCIDNNRGHIWEGVSRHEGSWTQCQYNSVSDSAEQSGYASWSRDYWLSTRDAQLHNMADWIAEESKALGIPITLLSDSQAQGGSWGVTFHSRLGGSGCGHSDPGSNYPINEVLSWAKGGTTSPAPTEEDVTASVAFNTDGEACYAHIGKDNKVYFRGPAMNSWSVVDPGSNAKSGCGIAAGSGGRIIITYTNQAGDVCTYYRPPDSQEFIWQNIGGNAR